jgi:hypothetical protein
MLEGPDIGAHRRGNAGYPDLLVARAVVIGLMIFVPHLSARF